MTIAEAGFMAFGAVITELIIGIAIIINAINERLHRED